MDDLPLDAKILKSLIAPARYSDGPTLYLICAADTSPCCIICEQTPEGKCRMWPEVAERGMQQAGGMIYQQAGFQS